MNIATAYLITSIVMTGSGDIDTGGFGSFLKTRGGDESTSAIMPEAVLESFLPALLQ